MMFFRKEKSPGLNVVPEKKPGKKLGKFFTFNSKRKDVQPLEVVGRSVPGKATTESQDKATPATTTTTTVHLVQIPVIFILGGPGSGKGTQCAKLLEKHPNLAYTSVGDLLRACKNEGFQQKMKEGKLVSLQDTLGLLREWVMDTIEPKHTALLIDGFPRDVEQCEAFENEFGADTVAGCLFYDAPEDVLLQRLKGRAESSGREDDNEETMKKRLETFQEKTLHVKGFFEKTGRLRVVDAGREVEEVFKDTVESVESWVKEAEVNALGEAQVCFVLGGPGSGKGTQCDRLKASYAVTHISTGDVLRDQVSRQTWIGRQCQTLMACGQMVPNPVLLHLVKQCMKSYAKEGKTRFLLDGFPRTLEQARLFDTELVNVQFVVFFECPADVLKDRLLKRGQSSGRADDNEETIKTRIQVFEKESVPVADHYAQLDKLIRIQSDRDVENVFQDTIKGVERYWSNKSEEEKPGKPAEGETQEA